MDNNEIIEILDKQFRRLSECAEYNKNDAAAMISLTNALVEFSYIFRSYQPQQLLKDNTDYHKPALIPKKTRQAYLRPCGSFSKIFGRNISHY